VKRMIMVAVAILFSLMFGLVGCLAMLGGVNSSQYAASLPCVRINNGTEVAAAASATLSASSSAEADSEQPRQANNAAAETDWWEGLTVKGGAMNEGQAAIAAEITGIVAGRTEIFDPYKQRVTVIALMTGIVESELQNLPYGHSDSAGVFQQRPSQGWGTYEEVTNVNYATNKFVDVLLEQPNWQTRPYGELAQAVQRSAHPDRYEQYQPEAEAIYARLAGSPYVQTADNCTTLDNVSRLEQAILAALGMVGDPYSWQTSREYDGAGFVEEAFRAADVDLPGSIEELAAYEGDEEAGVETSFIPAQDFISGKAELTRGDIVLTAKKGGNDPSDATGAGIYIGSSVPGELSIATYNVLGSTHTKGTGEPGVVRIEKAVKLILEHGFAVVGLQELQADQRAKLMNQLRPFGYEIYPDPPNYGRNGAAPPKIHSDNSIIWDTNQVTAVKGAESRLEMPYTHHGIRRDIPVVLLRDNTTQQVFYVVNTHDPAGPLYGHPRLRWLNAKQHAADMDKLVAEGKPVFFTGDFNSGFGVRTRGNTTYQDLRPNLTWCIMTESGSMLNAYDAWKGRGGIQADGTVEACPQQTTAERGIGVVDHVYVSYGVPVSDYQVIPVNRAVTGSDHPVVYVQVGSGEKPVEPTEGELGLYVGPKPPDGTIGLRGVSPKRLVGVIRLTISSPELEQVVVISGDWTLPVAKPYTLTAGFGECGSLWASCHTGQDFAAPVGTQVYAATSGEIVSAGWAGAYGNRIIIRSPDGLETWYCHLSSFDFEDRVVSVGTPIGKMGSSGNTTGSHLHFEVRPGGGAAVDPLAVLRDQGLDP